MYYLNNKGYIYILFLLRKFKLYDNNNNIKIFGYRTLNITNNLKNCPMNFPMFVILQGAN